jgi:hypothetical protein
MGETRNTYGISMGKPLEEREPASWKTEFKGFHKCVYVFTMHGVLTDTRDLFFSADNGGRFGRTNQRQ